MSKDKPQTTEVHSGSEAADDDVVSDPSEGSGDRADWADEGGATSSGPAPST